MAGATTSGSSSAGGVDLAALQARLALDRSQLADQILARLPGGGVGDSGPTSKAGDAGGKVAGTTTSNGASRGGRGIVGAKGVPSTAHGRWEAAAGAGHRAGGLGAFSHRPPTLGLGADPSSSASSSAAARGGGSQRLSQEETRLKGRLTGGLKRKRAEAEEAAAQRTHSGVDSAGQGKRGTTEANAEEEDEEEGSKAKAVGKARANVAKANGGGSFPDGGPSGPTAKLGSAARRKDPFQTAAEARKRGMAKASAAVASTAPRPTPAAEGVDDDEGGEAMPAALSKKERKKRAKQKRREQQQQQQQSSGVHVEVETPADGHPQGAQGTESGKEASLGKDRVTSLAPAASALASSGLTAHQRAMLSKLAGGRFRQINEALYTSRSDEALRLARGEADVMRAYHDGFREQTKTWPQVPVRLLADLLASRAAEAASAAAAASATTTTAASAGANGESSASVSKRAKKQKKMPPPPAPMLVVDLGAGEAPLAKQLASTHTVGDRRGGGTQAGSGAGTRIPLQWAPRVLSYDLLDSEDGWVRGLDVAAGLPLPGLTTAHGGGLRARAWSAAREKTAADESGVTAVGGTTDSDAAAAAAAAETAPVVDYAVLCLSLMGTNWVEMLIEARRILRPGGALLIAEVMSRFNTLSDFVALVDEVGFELRSKDTTNTHFALLEFRKLDASQLRLRTKEAQVPGILGNAEVGREGEGASSPSSFAHAVREDVETEAGLVQRGKEILKPCLYKRR